MQEIKIDIYPKTQSMHRTSLYFVQKEKKRVSLAKKIKGIKGDNYKLSMFLIFLPLTYFRKHDCSVCLINNSNLFFKGLVKIFKRKFGAGKETTLECLRAVAPN